MARKQVIPIRFTVEERTQLRELAKGAGISVSELVRRSALGRKMPAQATPLINRETYQAISRIGNNLNQLARAANEGRGVVLPQTLLDGLRGELRVAGLIALGIEIKPGHGPLVESCDQDAKATPDAIPSRRLSVIGPEVVPR